MDELQRKNLLERITELEYELANVKGTPCEVYSRIVGYFRPVKCWNEGKQEEFKDRVVFDNYKNEKVTEKVIY
jgi:hypothetical protein